MTTNEHKIKRAVVSVSDKTGIVDLCRELSGLGIEIFSTGGTKALLVENKIPVKSVSEITEFPEIMDGRLKTLHPKIHGGLLADLGKESHRNQMEEHDIHSIDLLIVNLYPFEETLANPNSTHAELIEKIDIGGPTMLRSAAKNYKWTVVLVNPAHYAEVIYSLKEKDMTISEELRLKLAGEVFSTTAYYDSVIAGYFNKKNEIKFPELTALPLKKVQNLRYGENPHQSAALYGEFDTVFNKIHGKELSYNNIIDINGAAGMITEFDETAVAIIKHTNPCGVATGKTLKEAYLKALSTDTVSAYGGIVAFSGEIDLEMAETVHDLFTEVLIAPSFTDSALELLTKKKNRRLITADYELLKSKMKFDFHSVVGGFLIQDTDMKFIDDNGLVCVTDRKGTDDEMKALLFAWKVCKHVKSNTIIYTNSDMTLGIGAGQMSRVDSSRFAVEKAQKMGFDLKGSVVASDAYFPFDDGLLEAAKAGATAVIQPGGSIHDADVIKAANENNIAMYFTGMRHFRH
jgi:phosphoribosylaminoimidazolecarboxamide formyltransferase/IMP cyclohydrolase